MVQTTLQIGNTAWYPYIYKVFPNKIPYTLHLDILEDVPKFSGALFAFPGYSEVQIDTKDLKEPVGLAFISDRMLIQKLIPEVQGGLTLAEEVTVRYSNPAKYVFVAPGDDLSYVANGSRVYVADDGLRLLNYTQGELSASEMIDPTILSSMITLMITMIVLKSMSGIMNKVPAIA